VDWASPAWFNSESFDGLSNFLEKLLFMKWIYSGTKGEGLMSNLKLVLWNMEWLDDLFTKDDQAVKFRPDDEKTAHSSGSTVKQRRDDLSGVLRELNPDMVIVVEGPSRPG
jgi:hypothetical protein